MGCISLTSVSRFEIYVFENIYVCIFVYSSSQYDTMYGRKVRPKIIISRRCDNSRVRCHRAIDVSSCFYIDNECDTDYNEFCSIMYLSNNTDSNDESCLTVHRFVNWWQKKPYQHLKRSTATITKRGIRLVVLFANDGNQSQAEIVRYMTV